MEEQLLGLVFHIALAITWKPLEMPLRRNKRLELWVRQIL